MRKLISRLAVVAAAGLAVTAVAAPAHADPTAGQDPGGYHAAVHVTLTGDYSGSLQASVPGPPPLCWWENLNTTMLDSDKVDTSDPKAVLKYYKKWIVPFTEGSDSAPGRIATPSIQYFKSIIKKVHNGADLTFYVLRTREGYHGPAKTIAQACGTSYTHTGQYGDILMGWKAFPTGNEPPPATDAKSLAEYAYKVMDLVRPDLDWNPKVPDLDDASVVNLPTWMWVRNRQAVAQRSVTASAAGISATVDAQTDQMTVSTPVGATTCTTSQAGTAYTAGTPASAACTLTFPRASAGYPQGFPVQSTTAWRATWSSNTGLGGSLPAKSRNATTDIPVDEIQTLVTSTD